VNDFLGVSFNFRRVFIHFNGMKHTCLLIHTVLMIVSCFVYFYLRQFNGVNGGENVFAVRSMCVCLSVCVTVCSGLVSQTSLKLLKLRTSNLTCMFSDTVQT